MYIISRRNDANSKNPKISDKPKYFGNGKEYPDVNDWVDAVMGNKCDVLIFVHGFNTSERAANTLAQKLENSLRGVGYPGALVTYLWPAKQEPFWEKLIGFIFSTPSPYQQDRETVHSMKHALVYDTQPLWRRSNTRVHILAHSMGAYMTMIALEHADQWLNGHRVFSSVFLGAADIKRNMISHGTSGATAFERYAERVVAYYSGADKVLDISSKWINDPELPRLGSTGLPKQPPTNATEYNMKPRYSQYNQTLHTTRFSHRWYLSDPAIAQHVKLHI